MILLNNAKKIYGYILNRGKKSLDLNHEQIILNLAKQLKPNIYVELGVYKSSLFNKMIPYVNSKLYAVDIKKDLEKFMKKIIRQNLSILQLKILLKF